MRNMFRSDRRVSAPVSLQDDPVQLDASSIAFFVGFDVEHRRSKEFIHMLRMQIYLISSRSHHFAHHDNIKQGSVDCDSHRNDTLSVTRP